MNKVIKDINKTIESLGYPSDFECLYDQIECIKSSSGRETFLVKCKKDNEYYIAKCYDKKIHTLIPDIQILVELKHKGIPKYIANYENDNYVIVVREYIEGTSLDEYLKENKLSQNDKLNICNKLADVLVYLHNQKNPVIHRDIKPRNIIVGNNNDIHLIDFDIARTYKNEKETDTVFFGTKVYAPPEQYGFEQTDQRSDIYSFGVLMHYMFYGDPKKEEVTIDKHLKTVIDKCTSFSPTDRYSSMKDVKNSITSKRNNKKKIIFVSTIITIVACFILIFTNKKSEPISINATFKEKTVANAARIQLGLNDNEPINEDDLLKINKIYILGEDVYKESSELYSHGPYDTEIGTINTLDDFKYFPNITEACIGLQKEIDLSGLINCKELRILDLKHTILNDLSPLSELEHLHSLFMFDSGVNDVTILNNLKHLERFDIGLTDIKSMKQIGVFEKLIELGIKMLNMQSLDGIELMPTIEIVWINGSQIDDISALAKLPNLKTVHTDVNNIDAVRKLLEGKDIEIICE